MLFSFIQLRSLTYAPFQRRHVHQTPEIYESFDMSNSQRYYVGKFRLAFKPSSHMRRYVVYGPPMIDRHESSSEIACLSCQLTIFITVDTLLIKTLGVPWYVSFLVLLLLNTSSGRVSHLAEPITAWKDPTLSYVP